MRTNKEVLGESSLTEDMHDNPAYWADKYLELEFQLATTQQRLAECESDAGRYRWLKESQAGKTGKEATVVFWLDEPFEPETVEQLDAAIDAAMGGEG